MGTHLHNLTAHHRFGEGKMAHTYEDMKREARDWLKTYLPQLDPEERLEELYPEEVLRRFDPEARQKGLDPEVRLNGVADWADDGVAV
ncbi:hypothetical protein Thiosp_01062 [Thiorhodovibrio litoralis]|nr:hypothetical protein Thiosp_01062 [Thiorhodovibrio litoralis]